MRVVVGAPVADRDWILPQWVECLENQTRPPDHYTFVVGEVEGTEPTQKLQQLIGKPTAGGRLSYAMDQTRFVPRQERNNSRREFIYGDFAWRRNRLLQMVKRASADVFLSLDTDILLEDPTVIARLLEMLEAAPLAAPCVFLHPLGRQSECYNAAFWQMGLDAGEDDRQWRRVTAADCQVGPILVDIPMAAVMMRREVIESCSYRYHECGEDMGFAQDLDRHGMPCLWDPGMEVRHVMSPEALEG